VRKIYGSVREQQRGDAANGLKNNSPCERLGDGDFDERFRGMSVRGAEKILFGLKKLLQSHHHLFIGQTRPPRTHQCVFPVAYVNANTFGHLMPDPLIFNAFCPAKTFLCKATMFSSHSCVPQKAI
jgi:hypothetical protein